MFRRMALTVCLVASCIWCLALVTRADSALPQQSPVSFKPVASVEALMFGQQVFFKQINEELKKPAGGMRNLDIQAAAEVLAELANVNRHNEAKEDYIGWATDLRDTAVKLAAEAKKKDADDARMKVLSKSIKGSCGACHDMYQ